MTDISAWAGWMLIYKVNLIFCSLSLVEMSMELVHVVLIKTTAVYTSRSLQEQLFIKKLNSFEHRVLLSSSQHLIYLVSDNLSY